MFLMVINMELLKKIFLFIIAFFLLFSNTQALEQNYLELNSEIALVYDLNTEELLYTKNITKKTPIASLTKILTTITALDLIKDLNYKVTITKDMLKNITQNASKAGLKVGDVLTYEDLLYAALLPSGADATQSLAIALTGSVSNFVKKMNEQASLIGMTNSHFLNTSGLDIEGQYSTAEDVLKLLKYALNNSTFKEIFTTRKYVLQNGLEIHSTIQGYEEALEIEVERIIGSKTGFTDYAGLCLASLVEVANHEILIITIKAPYVKNEYYNLKDHLAIIDYLDSNYLLELEPENEQNLNYIEQENSQEKKELYWLGGIPIIIILVLIFKINKKSKVY